mmetsp:Transcript_39502/g.71122  ORF Transcript_39502/g.71122 Transcript_39502/m.71122 type:complete len:116 (-) Transcript_39502:271-618(-)
MTTKCPRIAMSATMRQTDQNTNTKLLGKELDFILWSDMSRREIKFAVVVSGGPSSSTNDFSNHQLKNEKSAFFLDCLCTMRVNFPPALCVAISALSYFPTARFLGKYYHDCQHCF